MSIQPTDSPSFFDENDMPAPIIPVTKSGDARKGDIIPPRSLNRNSVVSSSSFLKKFKRVLLAEKTFDSAGFVLSPLFIIYISQPPEPEPAPAPGLRLITSLSPSCTPNTSSLFSSSM